MYSILYISNCISLEIMKNYLVLLKALRREQCKEFVNELGPVTKTFIQKCSDLIAVVDTSCGCNFGTCLSYHMRMDTFHFAQSEDIDRIVGEVRAIMCMLVLCPP